MGLTTTIENIRNKPEHIRVRYVWGAVAVCMFFVVLVWLFSLRVSLSTQIDAPSGPINEVREQFGDLGVPIIDPARPSINDLINPDADIADVFRTQGEQGQNQIAPSAGPDPRVNTGSTVDPTIDTGTAAGSVQGISKRIPVDVLPTVQ